MVFFFRRPCPGKKTFSFPKEGAKKKAPPPFAIIGGLRGGKTVVFLRGGSNKKEHSRS